MPGRPREAHVDEAVLAATVELLALMSFAQLSVELVAKEAHVGKATVYRRWPSKGSLAADAVGRFAPTPHFELEGDVAENTRAGFVAFASATMDSGFAHVLYSLFGEARNDPDLACTLRERYLQPRQKVLHEALSRCVEADAIRSDISLAAAQSLLLGPVMHGWVLTGSPPDQRFVDEVVGAVWMTLRPVPDS